MKYEVQKMQRGSQGQWFGHKAKRFTDESQALEYAERFAAEQQGVAGTRIVVRRRKGSVCVKEFRCG